MNTSEGIRSTAKHTTTEMGRYIVSDLKVSVTATPVVVRQKRPECGIKEKASVVLHHNKG